MPCRVRVVEGGDAFLRSHQEIAYSFLKLVAQRLYGLTNFRGRCSPDRRARCGHVGEALLNGIGQRPVVSFRHQHTIYDFNMRNARGKQGGQRLHRGNHQTDLGGRVESESESHLFVDTLMPPVLEKTVR